MISGFRPAGPVSAAFIADRSPFSSIMGPFGSAKTSSCIMKSVNIASEQYVSPRSGERLFKLGVVRDTLANMKRTTYKSIEEWFPKGADWGGGGSAMEPPYCKIGFALSDGTIARLWFDFVGLDVHNIEQLAKGWNISGYWLNEGDLLVPEVKTYLDGRAGRYPGKLDGGCKWYGGFADYNAPDTENYLYNIHEVEKPEGSKLFKQPSGLSAHAENKENLPAGYYERMCIGKEKWWIRRNVENKYGFSREGDPVYEQYNDDFHVADLTVSSGIPIVCHADAALRPAMIFTQIMPGGQRRVLGELFINGGAKQLGEAALAYLGKHFPGHAFRGGLIDPAANTRDENDSEAENYIEVLNRAMGLKGQSRFRPAPTNDPTKRQDAVKHFLQITTGSADPAYVIDSRRCPNLRKGFNSKYRFKKRVNGEVEDKPEKSHPYSDLHDANQYFCLDDGGYEIVTATATRQKQRGGSGGFRVAKVSVNV